MIKITRQRKSKRGVVSCSKCGKLINVGEEYVKAASYMQAPIVRCLNCYIRPYETSRHLYIRKLGDLKTFWKAKYGVSDNSIELITEDLECIKEEIEDNLSNMPEQLQDNSVLAERIENIDDCIDELQSINTDSDDLISSIENALHCINV